MQRRTPRDPADLEGGVALHAEAEGRLFVNRAWSPRHAWTLGRLAPALLALRLLAAGRAAGAADLWRNALEGPLQRVGDRALPRLAAQNARAIVASDLDRDGDLDLVLAHAKGLTRLDNLRQGELADLGVIAAPWAVAAVASADLDNDGFPDLVAAGRGLAAWHNRGGAFVPWPLAGLPASTELTSIVAVDADNDGRLDLAAAGPGGLTVLLQQADGGFKTAGLADAPKTAAAVVAVDLDADGDLDLAAAGAAGLHWLENQGGNRHHWLAVRLRGLDKAQRHRIAGELLEVIGLTGIERRYPHELSGGQQQRVALGRALIREPAVFLFDEPFSNLDATLRVRMRGEIKELHQRLGVTSIFVTHD